MEKAMILNSGEKIHVIHRRLVEKEPSRHFIGVVDAYENGLARVTGNVYTIDRTTFAFIRRPEKRTRLISIVSGDVLVNILPDFIDLEQITYEHKKGGVRVTDGSDWHLDISEVIFV